MERRAQIAIVLLSLFAAGSAGYVAGRRAFDDASLQRQAGQALLDPRTVSPQYRSTSAVATMAVPTDAERLNILQMQDGVQIWKVAVAANWNSTMVDYRLVIREKGKPDVVLASARMGGAEPPPQTDDPFGVVVSMTPIGDSSLYPLSHVKKLRVSIASGLAATESFDVDNPFVGSLQFVGGSNGTFTAPTTPGVRVEVPLMVASGHTIPADGYHPTQVSHDPVRLLLLTMQPIKR